MHKTSSRGLCHLELRCSPVVYVMIVPKRLGRQTLVRKSRKKANIALRQWGPFHRQPTHYGLISVLLIEVGQNDRLKINTQDLSALVILKQS